MKRNKTKTYTVSVTVEASCQFEVEASNVKQAKAKAKELAVQEGRRQRAEGTNWKGIVTPPNWRLPNLRFGRGFIPLLLSVVGRRQKEEEVI